MIVPEGSTLRVSETLADYGYRRGKRLIFPGELTCGSLSDEMLQF